MLTVRLSPSYPTRTVRMLVFYTDSAVTIIWLVWSKDDADTPEKKEELRAQMEEMRCMWHNEGATYKSGLAAADSAAKGGASSQAVNNVTAEVELDRV